MSEEAFDNDGACVLALFDAAEEYAPFLDQLIEKHKGQALPLLLMMGTNLCVILDMEAQKKGLPRPTLTDEERVELHLAVESIVNRGPGVTGKMLLSAVRCTSRKIKESAVIGQAERIAKGKQS